MKNKIIIHGIGCFPLPPKNQRETTSFRDRLVDMQNGVQGSNFFLNSQAC